MSNSEKRRLSALEALEILDTEAESAFDAVARLAALTFETPIALVSLVDWDRQWFKARVGLDVAETPREHAFCAHSIEQHDGVLVVEDAADDPRFAHNPLVVGDPGIRFYAGASIHAPGGERLGTLCVIDRSPRTLDDSERAQLSLLAAQVDGLIAVRSMARQLDAAREHSVLFEHGFERSVVPMQIVDLDGYYLRVNEAFAELTGRTVDDIVGRHWRELSHPAEIGQLETRLANLPERDSVFETRKRYVKPDGSVVWGSLHVTPIEWGGGMRRFTQVIDVTAEVEAREALEASELRHRSLVDEAIDAIARLDARGVIVDLNPAGGRLLGGRPEQFVGTRLVDAVASSVADVVSHHIASVVETRSTVEVSRLNMQPASGGDPTWVRLRSHPEGSGLGEVRFIHVVATDVTEAVENEQRLEALALVDPLTGLSNRAAVFDRLQHSLDRLHRHPRSGVAVALVDLDYFKSVNDGYGHAVGDQVLVAVGRALAEACRAGDTAGRIGGDEFVVVFEDVPDREEVPDLAQRLTDAIGQVDVALPGGAPLYIACSVGAAWTGRPGDAQALVADADSAMFKAKREGRGRIVVDSASTGSSLFESTAVLLRELSAAVEANDFVLRYQPICAANGEVVAVEALLRWRHDVHGLLTPDVFLSHLLESGNMVVVGEWVLRTATAQLGHWTDASGRSDFDLHLNLSPAEVASTRLPALFESVVDRVGVDARRVVFEVTEDALSRTVVSPSSMTSLGATGCKLALDDFGAGTSSLSHLRYQPLHALKIDAELVRRVVESSPERQIVAGIAAMARGLGLDVVAEGIETEDQLLWLRETGCTGFQGWHLASAMSAEEFQELLVDNEPLPRAL